MEQAALLQLFLEKLGQSPNFVNLSQGDQQEIIASYQDADVETLQSGIAILDEDTAKAQVEIAAANQQYEQNIRLAKEETLKNKLLQLRQAEEADKQVDQKSSENLLAELERL